MPSHFNHLHPQKVTEDDTGGSVEPNYQEVHKVSTQPQPAQPTSPTTKVLGSSQPPRPGSHSIHVSGKFHKRTIEVFMLASLNNFPFRHDMRKCHEVGVLSFVDDLDLDRPNFLRDKKVIWAKTHHRITYKN